MAELKYLTLCDPHESERPRHLAYFEWGEPSNPEIAVCVHGLSRNARDFDRLAAALSRKYRVICPDMAGRGRSSWLVNKSNYNYSLYISDCLALLEAVKARDVTWIGTSMGGIIGMMIAATQKHAISALVLNDVGATVSAEGLRRILGYVGTRNSYDTREAAMLALQSILSPFHISGPEQWDYMFGASFIALPQGRYALAYDPAINQPFRDAVSKPEGIADVDLTAFWKEVRCRTLILRGEQSDILKKHTAESMLRRDGSVELREIKDTGHAPALIDPSQMRIILDWAAVPP